MPDPVTPIASTSLDKDPSDIESGKMLAVLSYLPVSPVNLIISIVCLVQKNNAFSLYHAKQSMALSICMVVAMIVSLALICVVVGLFLYPVVLLGYFVIAIIGIVNAAGGKYKPLPLVGGIADKLFGGIHKV